MRTFMPPMGFKLALISKGFRLRKIVDRHFLDRFKLALISKGLRPEKRLINSICAKVSSLP